MAETYLLRLRGHPFKTLLIDGRRSRIAFAVAPNAARLSARAARERLGEWHAAARREPDVWGVEPLVVARA